MSDEVLVTSEGGIMTITINRPKAKNAVTKAVAEGIAAALDDLDGKDENRVAILTGADGTFCSGMDLKGFLKGETPEVPGRGFGGLCSAIPKKPLIAAVEGYALAGGFELCLACDLVVAADDSKFGVPEVKRGLVAAAGGLIRLPRQVPPRIAMELALTGDFVGAERAYEIGMINRLTKSGGALAGAIELANAIVENGPLALAVSKQVVLESQNWTTDEMFDKQNEIAMPVFSSADAMEGAAAFAEKRKPNWTGK